MNDVITGGAQKKPRNVEYSLDVASGAPLSITINGKDYKMSRLEFGILGEFKAKIKNDRIRAAQFAANDIANPYLKNDLMAKVIAAPVGNDAVIEELTSPENLAWVVWRCCHEHDKSIKIKEIQDLGIENLEQMSMLLGSLFGGSDEDSKSGDDSDPELGA